MDKAAFKEWFTDQMSREGLPEFFARMETYLNACVVEALAAGDTDFAKGKVGALNWVLSKKKTFLLKEGEDGGSAKAPMPKNPRYEN